MTKLNSANRKETAIRELTADELDLVSGGGKNSKPAEKPQPYLVVTMEEALITSY